MVAIQRRIRNVVSFAYLEDPRDHDIDDWTSFYWDAMIVFVLAVSCYAALVFGTVLGLLPVLPESTAQTVKVVFDPVSQLMGSLLTATMAITLAKVFYLLSQEAEYGAPRGESDAA